MKALIGNELERAVTPEAAEFVESAPWPTLNQLNTITEEDGSALADFAILGIGKHRVVDLVSNQ